MVAYVEKGKQVMSEVSIKNTLQVLRDAITVLSCVADDIESTGEGNLTREPSEMLADLLTVEEAISETRKLLEAWDQ